MLQEQNLSDTKSTEEFIRMIDRFFDCLNVSKNENYKQKPDLSSYKSVDDPRFQVNFLACL